MDQLYHQLIDSAAESRGPTPALVYEGNALSYASLREAIEAIASGIRGHGLSKGGRVAVYLPKQEETVIAFFAISRAGGMFVPVNPVLKPRQVGHILSDSGASMLVTSADRARFLAETLPECPSLKQVIIIDADEQDIDDAFRGMSLHQAILSWQELLQCSPTEHPYIEADDNVAILYTSGSTGKSKGVVVTHRNLVTGSESVCNFLNISQNDRILALLPFSFDYGLNQLSSAIRSGACLVLMNYLLPQDVTRLVVKEAITGLAAVPSLWAQLANLDWPESAQHSLRYITSSGGTMPQPVLKALRNKLPQTDIFLMYGLTEAFRSTYLAPEELSHRPTSMGKAIPNAHLEVLRADGSPCEPGEPGELVHSGPLVANGYWNNPEKTARHFRPLPGSSAMDQHTGLAVWTGDTVIRDQEGYFYFVGREDDMIKTSGYRVSPTEVEDIIHETGLVNEVAVFGVPHPVLGQAIVAVVTEKGSSTGMSMLVATDLAQQLRDACNKALPMYMVPAQIDVRPEIPKTPHGKLDRKHLSKEMQGLFTDTLELNI